MNKRRKQLMIELERIIGNEVYNAKIQNWGPGGVFEGEGARTGASRSVIPIDPDQAFQSGPISSSSRSRSACGECGGA